MHNFASRSKPDTIPQRHQSHTKALVLTALFVQLPPLTTPAWINHSQTIADGIAEQLQWHCALGCVRLALLRTHPPDRHKRTRSCLDWRRKCSLYHRRQCIRDRRRHLNVRVRHCNDQKNWTLRIRLAVVVRRDSVNGILEGMYSYPLQPLHQHRHIGTDYECCRIPTCTPATDHARRTMRESRRD